MAQIDVSELMIDPDFADTGITLITRLQTVNAFGETVLTETSQIITAVIQDGPPTALNRSKDGAILTDYISIYYRGVLNVESTNGYTDIVVWKGREYQVKEITEDFQNYGHGFTKAICELIRPNKDA